MNYEEYKKWKYAPLEMCMDVPFDLKLAKLIIQPTWLNEEGLLQSTR
jgi:hypothetical protein